MRPLNKFWETPRATRYPELHFVKDAPDLWRIVDASTGARIGPQYKSKAELLADLDRYAKFFGCGN